MSATQHKDGLGSFFNASQYNFFTRQIPKSEFLNTALLNKLQYVSYHFFSQLKRDALSVRCSTIGLEVCSNPQVLEILIQPLISYNNFVRTTRFCLISKTQRRRMYSSPKRSAMNTLMWQASAFLLKNTQLIFYWAKSRFSYICPRSAEPETSLIECQVAWGIFCV